MNGREQRVAKIREKIHGKPEGWYDWMWWAVVEIYAPIDVGVHNMTHDEIVSSLLSDLLRVHFDMEGVWVPWYELFRFIKTERQKDRVLEALCDSKIHGLTIEHAEYPQLIRLRPDHDSLQKAMDIAGCWFDGFEIPEGVEVISLSPKGRELIEEIGIDSTARYLAWRYCQEREKGSG